MRLRFRSCLTSSILVAGLFPLLGGFQDVEGQIRVTAIVVGLEEVDSHEDIEWLRFGSSDGPPLQVGQELQNLGQLRSREGLAEVELACPDGDPVFLSGHFRALIPTPAPDVPCVLDVQSGTADVLAFSATEVRLGDAVAGSEGTHYRVQVGTDPVRGPWTRVVVYEGSVRVRSAARQLDDSLGHGDAMVLSRGEASRTPMHRGDVEGSAATLARVAAARSLSDPDQSTAYESLVQGFRAVLQNPGNVEARFDLAAAGAVYGSPSSALVYQAQRLQRLDPGSAARALYVEADLHAVRGDSAAATTTRARAVARDTAVAAEVRLRYGRTFPGRVPYLQTTGTEEAAPPPAGAAHIAQPGPVVMMQANLARISVGVSATPETVRPGEVLTVVAVARGPDGTPVADVPVTLRSRGGEWFPGGGRSVQGRTNARGEFRAAWICRSCDAAYRFTAEAARGEEQATGTVTVRIERGR